MAEGTPQGHLVSFLTSGRGSSHRHTGDTVAGPCSCCDPSTLLQMQRVCVEVGVGLEREKEARRNSAKVLIFSTLNLSLLYWVKLLGTVPGNLVYEMAG